MRAESGHMAVVKHNDLVRVPDRRHALRDQHDRGFPRKLRQRLAQRCVRREVQRGGAVVQNEKLGPAYKCAGDGQPLALAAGEIAPAWLDRRVQLALLILHDASACAARSASQSASSDASALPQ